MRFLIFILLILLFQSCNKQNEGGIHLLFTGDILLSRIVKQELDKKQRSPWTEMKSVFSKADLLVGNFEGAVGDSLPTEASNIPSPRFNIKVQDLKWLKQAGFNALVMENNHSCDLGKTGKSKTYESLKAEGMEALHFNNSPHFFEVKGKRIAVVVLNLIPDQDSCQLHLPSVAVKQKLRLAQKLSNLVVVYIHWGSELMEWPNEFQRRNAKWLIANGADLIIGCHPHVVQPAEMIDGKPVFFSLGNHLFDQKYPETKNGLVLDCTIKGNTVSFQSIFTHTQKGSFYPSIKEIKESKLSVKLRKDWEVDGMTLKAESYDRGMDPQKIVLKAFVNNKQIWRIPPKSIVTISSCQIDSGSSSLFCIERHYSNMDSSIDLRPYIYRLTPHGIQARWRGSALAWPILDAVFDEKGKDHLLYALHRGDSYLCLDRKTQSTRIAAYRWNGFGFDGVPAAQDSAEFIRYLMR